MDGGRREGNAAELAEELRRAGAPQEKIDEVEHGDDGVIEVLEPNWNAFEVWRRCQPTPAGMGVPCGIAAQEIRLVARALGVRFCGDLLDRVHTMAAAADAWRAEHGT